MSEIENLGQRRNWGGEWLNLLEAAPSLSQDDLDRGEAYARHDWQLEVDVEPGLARATARTGPRLSYEVLVEADQLNVAEWQQFLELIAVSSAKTAALFDRVLEIDLLDQANEIGLGLFPGVDSLRSSCACNHSGALCKHVAALLYLLGDAFTEDPFELLIWRGMDAASVLEAVAEMRSGGHDEPATGTSPQDHAMADSVPPGEGATAMPAQLAWSRSPGPVPRSLPLPDEPPDAVDWASPTPKSAPFSARGLALIANDAGRRAFDLLRHGEPTWLQLDRTSDLARIGATAEGGDQWGQIVSAVPWSGQEFRARTAAWRIAQSAGVNALDGHSEVKKLDDSTQLRRASDNLWYRFEKRSGRWAMTEGPVPESAI